MDKAKIRDLAQQLLNACNEDESKDQPKAPSKSGKAASAPPPTRSLEEFAEALKMKE